MAQQGNYSDPVNPTYEATGAMYNRVVSTLMKDLSADDPALGFVVVATHNEDSVRKAVGKAQEVGLLDEKNEGGKLAFAQIFGMAEQISLPLGMNSFVFRLML